jgi:hypothetical protein
MVPNELLRLVDTIHRDKNMDKETILKAIEAALVSAAKKHYGEAAEIVVEIDRATGSIRASHNGVRINAAEIAERVGAQSQPASTASRSSPFARLRPWWRSPSPSWPPARLRNSSGKSQGDTAPAASSRIPV